MFGGRLVHYQLAQGHANRNDGDSVVISSILHTVYLLCDFLLLHLRRGAQEGLIVPPQSKSPVRLNKKPHCSSFSCLHRCTFPARGVVLAFLKVKSLHASDPLISLSGAAVWGGL